MSTIRIIPTMTMSQSLSTIATRRIPRLSTTRRATTTFSVSSRPTHSAASPSAIFEDGNTLPAGWQAPANQATVNGVVNFIFDAFPNVDKVEFSAYYATNPADITTVGWHLLGNGTQQPDKSWHFAWDSSQIADRISAGEPLTWRSSVCRQSTDQPNRLSPGCRQQRQAEGWLHLTCAERAKRA